MNPPDDRDLLPYESRPVLKRLDLYHDGLGWHASLDVTYLYTLTDPGRDTLQLERMFEALLRTGEGGDQIQ